MPDDPTAPLTGRWVTVTPYIRGVSPRDTLVRLWLLMETCDMASTIFWSQQVSHEAKRGDLESYVQAFSQRLSLAVSDRVTDDLVGHVWLEHVRPHDQAQIGFFYRRSHWGRAAREGTTLAMQWAAQHLRVHRIWGMSPWPLAIAHGKAVGGKLMGVLPGYALGKPLYIVCKEMT